jgi:ankyrin repeat protein
VGAIEVAKLLLEHGADPSLTADHGFTPLAAAVANRDTELAELLRSHMGEG